MAPTETVFPFASFFMEAKLRRFAPRFGLVGQFDLIGDRDVSLGGDDMEAVGSAGEGNLQRKSRGGEVLAVALHGAERLAIEE
jgi:hypothetical protein